MKDIDAAVNPQQAKFTAALSSVLAADPTEIRDKERQAKDETPLPHKRWKYDPEVDRA